MDGVYTAVDKKLSRDWFNSLCGSTWCPIECRRFLRKGWRFLVLRSAVSGQSFVTAIPPNAVHVSNSIQNYPAWVPVSNTGFPESPRSPSPAASSKPSARHNPAPSWLLPTQQGGHCLRTQCHAPHALPTVVNKRLLLVPPNPKELLSAASGRPHGGK